MQQVIRNEGLLNNALIWLGVIDSPLQIMYTDTANLLGMTYVYLPLMVLPLYASIEKLDSGWWKRATISMRAACRSCAAS
jgi:spermidine/putrescine transport system permease protein